MICKQSDKTRIITDSYVIDNNGNTIVPFGLYQQIGIIGNNLLCVSNNGRWGLLDGNGHVLLECIFDNMFGTDCDWFLLLKDGLYGASGRDGKIIADCIFNRIGNYYEDFLWVENNGLFGVIDKKGNIVTECIYESPYDENLKAMVLVNHSNNKENSLVCDIDMICWGLVSEESRPLYYPKCRPILGGCKEDGKLKVCERFSIVDERGKTIVPCDTYQDMRLFSDNVFIVRKNSLEGLIDKNGTVVIECIYNEIDPVSETIAQVYKDGLTGLIDSSGKVVLDCIYKRISFAPYGDTMWWNIIERNGHFGVIDYEGNFLADCVYDAFDDEFFDNEYFDDTLALKKDGLYVFMNNYGEVVASGIESVGFVCGLLVAKKGGRYGLFDKRWNAITDFIYDSVSEDNDNWIKVCKNGLWGLIDESGKVVVECLFDSIERKDSDTESSYTLKKKHKLFPNSDDSNSIDPSDLPF